MVLSWDRQQRPNGEVWSIQQLFQESIDRSDLFVPRVRTTIAQTRSFAIIGPSLWNALPFTLRETFLSGSLSSSLSLSLKPISSLGVLALGALLNGLGCERRYINY